MKLLVRNLDRFLASMSRKLTRLSGSGAEQTVRGKHHPGRASRRRLSDALHAAREGAVGGVPRYLIEERALQVVERLLEAALA